MKVLIIRHGPAGDRVRFAKTGKPDARRPLTAKGREKMRQAAKGLKRLAPRLDLVATSPYDRARQTAEIVSRVLGIPELVSVRELVPDAAPAALLSWLRGRNEGALALVGHEPQLGRFIAHVCAQRSEPITELKKGQVVFLKLDSARGRAKILWSLRPSQLRRLAR